MFRLFIAVAGTLFLAWAGAVSFYSVVVNGHRVQSGPQHESLLYQNYDPEQVVRTFRDESERYSTWNESASQLVKSVEQSKTLCRNFTMPATQESDLMSALREDTLQWLKVPGITVTTFHSEADGEFTYTYVTEHGSGSISVAALTHQLSKRRYPISAGLDDVQLKIALQEKWTRPASETQWWMAVVD